MDYNTTRQKLILPEYGRNIQNMVHYATSLADRDERQHCAETIIQIMANMFPQQKDSEDFKQALWDHLAFISDYKLDIDYPYPVNNLAAQEAERPHLNYPENACNFRHYGHTLEKMIAALPDILDEEERICATELVVSQMAKSLCIWNKNVLTPEKLANDIDYLTNGRMQLDIPLARLNDIITTAAAQTKPQTPKKKKK